MGMLASKFQSSEELSGKTQVKFHHQFHSPALLSVSYITSKFIF